LNRELKKRDLIAKLLRKDVELLIEVLKNYKHISNEIEHIKEELINLRTKAYNPRQSIISDMPKGSPVENDKLAALMIKFEELESKYNELLNKLLEQQKIVETMIEALEPFERDLIRYRYIDGLPWFKVQEKLNVSQRTVFRQHEQIIKKLEKMALHGIK
jgi:RNA polymerase sigma factor (sigma-70 family)